MSHSGGLLPEARVAVVSTSLDPTANELWQAARAHVGELLVVGARRADQSPRVGEVALPEVDGGRGLIYRHLIGLRRLLRDFRPDLVHVNGEAWALTVQELVGTHGNLVVHGAENRWEHGGRIEQLLRRHAVARAARRISGYASWNEEGADHVRELARRLGRDLPTLVLPAILPPLTFRHTRWAPTPMSPDAPVKVLLVGQVVKKKGFDLVVEACGRLERPVHVMVCGEGEEEGPLRAHASRLGVDVTMRGLLDVPALATAMASSHVLVQPSRTIADWSEQFGRSVAEAMSVGIPCLVSDSGELPVLVGREPEAMFHEDDVAGLTDLLRRTLANDDYLHALSTRQSTLARRYAPETAATQLARFWVETLS